MLQEDLVGFLKGSGGGDERKGAQGGPTIGTLLEGHSLRQWSRVQWSRVQLLFFFFFFFFKHICRMLGKERRLFGGEDV